MDTSEQVSRKIKHVYNVVENSRKRYGTLKKCEFHLHTPASACYTLYEGKAPDDYKKMTDEDLVQVAVVEGLMTQEAADEIIKSIDNFKGEEYQKSLSEQGKPYRSLKEYISYQLIVHKLIANAIQVAVVTDHHTTVGYEKLKYALLKYYEMRKDKISKSLDLMLGVEISCSELNHVVVIIEDKCRSKIDEYLSEIAVGEGTYLSSYQVITDVVEKGAIGYIAHINSSDLNGSKVYNSTLFQSDSLSILGLTCIDGKEAVLSRIKNFCSNAESKFCFIAEGDSHSIDTIGTKNAWVKFDKVNFTSLKKAFEEHRICVYNEKPKKSDKYIKGIVVTPGRFGFLQVNPGKINTTLHVDDRNDLVIPFSRDLNCIVGGRGTGKSTILNAIETAFTLDYTSKDNLKFISRHSDIYFIFFCDGVDYILRFIPQTNEIYGDDEELTFLPKAFEQGNLASHWVKLYKVENGEFSELRKDDGLNVIFKKFYRRGYSINNLVSKIESKEIGSFIRDTVMHEINYKMMGGYEDELARLHYKGNHKKYLKENLLSMMDSLRNQSDLVNEKIKSFNERNSDNLKIVYSTRIKDSEEYLKDLLAAIGGRGFVANTYLTWNEVSFFTHRAVESIGLLRFLYLLDNSYYRKIEEFIKLSEYHDANNRTFDQVDQGLEELTEKNIKRVYQAIKGKIFGCKRELLSSIQTYIEKTDDFTLNFNINHREHIQQNRPVFKDLSELSLGQKVVALLTFVFCFGEHIGDNTPLVIDQPEDNLDNQYIFKNLVDSLRRIKNKRQVIIVTHSSTIVTNADAEQVVVMESDNKRGWVRDYGYPRDKSIIKHIINYLEGGIPSFKNKMDTYKMFINELN